MRIGLKSFLGIVVLLLFASDAFGQRKELTLVPWAPPADLDFPSALPRPTVPQPMVTALRLGTMSIRLDRTELAAVREQLGGELGRRGDAGSTLRWLCYGGEDTTGRWALWLTAGEIDGPTIGSFEWRRVAANARFDPLCTLLPKGATVTLSPAYLHLGMSQSEVFHHMGTPTVHHGDMLDYEHAHKEKAFDFSNSVAVRFVSGIVDSILVAVTVSN